MNKWILLKILPIICFQTTCHFVAQAAVIVFEANDTFPPSFVPSHPQAGCYCLMPLFGIGVTSMAQGDQHFVQCIASIQAHNSQPGNLSSPIAWVPHWLLQYQPVLDVIKWVPDQKPAISQPGWATMFVVSGVQACLTDDVNILKSMDQTIIRLLAPRYLEAFNGAVLTWS